MSDINLDQENKTENVGLISEQLGYGLMLGGWVAFPVLFGFFIGRYLVSKLNLPEYILYLIIGLFVVISFWGLIKTTLNYIKENDK